MRGLLKLPSPSNSVLSQSFGRRVYKMEQGEHTYWLKMQMQQTHTDYMYGFMHELEIYDQLNRLESTEQSIICNFAILNPLQHFQIEAGIIESALWIEDLPKLFDRVPDELTIVEIHSRLWLSLDVLGHLHELGFVHGDLKVEHFRKSMHGASLIDFEQTYSLEKIIQVPNTATPRYMAPELFHADQKSYSSDIYALGIIWLEWLTQTRLKQKSYLDWAKLHCQSLKIELPERYLAFSTVLTMMLQKNKQQRCTNIYQLKQVLSKID